MIIGRGGNTKPLKMAFENPEEPIYITTKEELKETLYKLVDEVEPFNAKIDLSLIKDTHFEVIKNERLGN
jgi:hypothetical protein